jgi:hypothetical protein
MGKTHGLIPRADYDIATDTWTLHCECPSGNWRKYNGRFVVHYAKDPNDPGWIEDLDGAL